MRHLARVSVSIVFLILFTPGLTGAQPLMAGVKIGIDISSLPNAGEVFDQVVQQGSTETSSKIGLTFGGFAVVPIKGRLSFQPELMFVAKGVKLKEAANNGTLTTSIRYLEFPLLLRYGGSVAEHAVFLVVGPTFGIKASTGAHLDGPSQSVDRDIDGAIRSLDAGVAFGAGLDYQRYLFEVRYTQGLSDIGVDGIVHADGLRNRVFAVLAGIRLK